MQNICIVPVLYVFATHGLKISDMQPLDIFLTKVDEPRRMEHDEIASSPMKDSGDVHAYRELFQKWSGKRILLAGDSLLFRTWLTIADAAAELGIKRSQTLESIFWQNSAEPSMVHEEFKWTNAHEHPGTQGLLYSLHVGPTQSSPDSAQISPATIKFYRFYTIQGREPLFNSTWDALFSGAATYDAIFSNLGHHFVAGGTEINRRIIMSACNEARSRGAKHFTLVEHAPSHFKTQSGDYVPGVGCSCDIGVADLRTQPTFRWKRIMEDVAAEMNVSTTNFWDEFADKCDKHPGPMGDDKNDCLHYVRDFDTEAQIVRALMQTQSEGQ